MSTLEIAMLKESFVVHKCPRCGWRMPVKISGYDFYQTQNQLKDEYIAELESLVRDMFDAAAKGEFDVGEEFKFNERMRELGIEVG